MSAHAQREAPTSPPVAAPAFKVREVYRRLHAHYGPQRWWPAQGPFEMMVGAILTQAAAWSNVERAMANLAAQGALSPPGLRRLSPQELARAVYPAGYFNAKAKKLQALAGLLEAHGDDLGRLFARDTAELRQALLGVHGIGPETADSILLYAAGRPAFVVDTYTGRLCHRLGLVAEGASYHRLQRLFTEALPPQAPLFNEYHALMVRHGKERCRKRAPRCSGCPLLSLCPWGQREVGPGPKRLQKGR